MADTKISGASRLTGTGIVKRPVALAASNTAFALADNYEATSDPGVGDDDADGFSIGSLWQRKDSGEVWRCIDATTGAAVWKLAGSFGVGPSLPAYALASTIFLTPDTGAVAISGGVMAANRLYMTPVFVSRRKQFTTYGIVVTVLSASTGVRLGLYNCNQETWQPTTKLDEAVSVVDTSTGTGSVTRVTKAFTANQTLNPGWYMLASLSDGAPAVIRFSGGNPRVGMNFSTTAAQQLAGVYRDAVTYTTLPADESAQSYALGNVAMPVVGIR